MKMPEPCLCGDPACTFCGPFYDGPDDEMPGTPGDEDMPQPRTHHHPKSPHASRERLDGLIGIVSLDGPAPSHKFLDGEED